MYKTKNRYTFSLLVALFLCQSAMSQKLWTLDACLRYAEEHNLTLKQNELNVKQAEIVLEESRYRRLPNLNGSVGNIYNFGRSIDPFTNANVQRNSENWRFSLSTGVILFNGFQIHNTIKQQQQNVYASRFDQEVAKNDIGMSIANAFLQVLFAKELVGVAKEQVKSTQVQLERAEQFFNAGRAAESMVLEMKAQLANDNLNLVNAENQELMARITLFQLLMLPPDGNDISIPETEETPEIEIFTASQLITVYRSKAPELKAAEKRAEAGMYAWKVAQGAYSPRLSLGADIGTLFSNQAQTLKYGDPLVYQQYYDGSGNPVGQVPVPNITGSSITPFGNQMNNNLGQTIALNLAVPIFNNYATRAGVKRAEIGYQNALLNQEIVNNNIDRQVTQAFNEYMAAKARFEASKTSFEAQENSFRFAEKRYEENLISDVDYRVFLNNLISARSNFIQAKYELMFRYRIIQFYQNGTIYLEK